MTTYVYRPKHPNASENGYVTKEEALEWDYHQEIDNRAVIGNQVVKLNFISDNMEPTRHMCDGKYYNSKREFRKVTKAHGCIEVGNDYKVTPRGPIKLDKRQRREDIKRSIHELKNK